MIKKSGKGYVVTSHAGKRLSKRGLTHAQAVKRLRQVEYFKHHPKAAGKKKRRRK